MIRQTDPLPSPASGQRRLSWPFHLLIVVMLVVWQLNGCEPKAPTEVQSEPTSESRSDATTDGQGVERTEKTTPETAEEPTTPERTPEPSFEQPDAIEPIKEPVQDASDASELADPSEPLDAAEPQPEPPGEVQTDGADAGEPPRDGQEPPEPSGDTIAEQAPDSTGQCLPHQPPTSAPQEWVYDTGEGVSYATVKTIKADAQGFLYLCGSFSGGPADFHGQMLQAPSGGEQMFVMKLDAAGKALWVKTLPGQGSRSCQALTLGASGEILITGSFSGSITLGTKTYTAQSNDAFVASLNTCGDIQWLSQAGGQNSDSGNEIALDSKGQIYVYGQFYGPASFGSLTVTTQDVGSVFVAKMTPQGTFTWVATGGSQSPDTPAGMGVTPQGEVYIAGSSFLPVTFGPYKLNSPNPFELFVAKLDTKGSFLWATQTTGTGRIVPYRAGLDTNGRFYITGELDGEKTFDQTKYTSPPHGDIFLTQMDSAGKFKWVLRPKGTSHLHPYGIAFDGAARYIFMAGDYSGSPTFGSTQLSSATNLRSFVTRVNTSPTPSFTWTTSTTGSGAVRAQSMTLGPKGDVFVAGNFQSSGVFGSISRTKQATKFYVFAWKIPKP